jgi:hypothetical protein
MLHSPENAERRRGAIAALRELLRQGLDVETSCRVQDWPCFLSQALNRLMATEIVDLIMRNLYEIYAFFFMIKLMVKSRAFKKTSKMAFKLVL